MKINEQNSRNFWSNFLEKHQNFKCS